MSFTAEEHKSSTSAQSHFTYNKEIVKKEAPRFVNPYLAKKRTIERKPESTTQNENPVDTDELMMIKESESSGYGSVSEESEQNESKSSPLQKKSGLPSIESSSDESGSVSKSGGGSSILLKK